MTSSFKLNTKSTPIVKKSQVVKSSESIQPLQFIFTPFPDSPKLKTSYFVIDDYSSPDSSPYNSYYSPPLYNGSPNYNYNYSNNIEPFYSNENNETFRYPQQFHPTSYSEQRYQSRYPIHYSTYQI